MPLTMLLGALVLLRRSLWTSTRLSSFAANRQLRHVAFWRKSDKMLLEPGDSC